MFLSYLASNLGISYICSLLGKLSIVRHGVYEKLDEKLFDSDYCSELAKPEIHNRFIQFF